MAKRYIEAADAINLLSIFYNYTDAERYDLALAISAVPIADVVERKRGKWIDAKPRSGQLGKVCSACGNEAYWDSDYGQQLFDYCPYCGSNNGEESDNG